MSTKEQEARGGAWYLSEQKLFERIFTDSAQPAELLIEQLFGQGGETPCRFGVVGLYGRTWNGPGREMLFEAFDEIIYDIALPGLTLLLLRSGTDCRETAERISRWLWEYGLTLNTAYLPGECQLSEARQTRAVFEAAAAKMFFCGGSECLSLDAWTPVPRAAELREDSLRQLRRIRQDMTACLVRGEAGCVHERLEEYFRLIAQDDPDLFREQCAGLYFHVDEELAVPDEQQDAYRRQLRRTGKTVFRLIEEANNAQEIMEHISWYIDQMLARYRPMRETTSSRVAAYVEEYVGSHYMEPICVEDIAVKVGLSANYVRSIFKNSRGQTIQSYVSEYRLEMACQLLRNSSVTVSRIGQMVGYNNVSYFCASFQKRYGKTPSEWRRDL